MNVGITMSVFSALFNFLCMRIFRLSSGLPDICLNLILEDTRLSFLVPRAITDTLSRAAWMSRRQPL